MIRTAPLAFLAVLLCAGVAQAQVFNEDWESGSGRWTVRNTAGPIVLTTEAGICSSTYQHETLLASGGRVFTTNGIAVTDGATYCLTAWVRGSVNTQPFIGVNAQTANGATRTRALPHRPHRLPHAIPGQ